jgi:hypothetical protein
MVHCVDEQDATAIGAGNEVIDCLYVEVVWIWDSSNLICHIPRLTVPDHTHVSQYHRQWPQKTSWPYIGRCLFTLMQNSGFEDVITSHLRASTSYSSRCDYVPSLDLPKTSK